MVRLVSSLPLAFLPVLLLVLHVESVAKFVFTGQLVCDKPFFRYNMVLWEKDDGSGDDVMSNKSPVASKDPHYYKITGEQDGDEYFSFAYEVYMIIVHDCNHPDKPYRKLTVPLGKFPLMDKTNYKVVNITVTDQGEETNDIIGFRGEDGKLY